MDTREVVNRAMKPLQAKGYGTVVRKADKDRAQAESQPQDRSQQDKAQDTKES